MKSKKKNKKVPAYAFGMDQLGDISELIGVAGSSMEGATEEGSGANIAGSALGGLGTGAAAGAMFGPIGAGIGAVVGGVGGALKGVFAKKKIQKQNERKQNMRNAAIAANATSNMNTEYWNDNDLAYSFENGGILPDLAYVDNNEVIRGDDGTITKVPNTRRGTDNHLIDASNLESVLSDKLKRPGTNKTFAQEGEKLTKMTKPSKGKDRFAQASDELNRRNANKKYNQLLAEQEEVKAKKGIKSKVKDIPAYAYGYDGDDRRIPNKSIEEKYFGNIRKYLLPRGGTYKAQKNAGYGRNFVTGDVNRDYYVAPGYPKAPFLPVDTPEIYVNESDPMLMEQPIETKPRRNGTGGAKKAAVAAPVVAPRILQADIYPDQYMGQLARTPKMVEAPTQFTPKQAKARSAAESKPTTKGSNPLSGSANLSGLLDLAPTMYNFFQGLRGPETEEMVTNPYIGSINRNMARRRMNINPAIEANRRSRAIANYNAANVNPNTGGNLALRTQLAASEYANNADMYATKQNADNAYMGEYSNMLNNLGQQWAQSQTLTNDLNARNRAAARNYTGTALSQLGQWSQVRRQEGNQYNRDMMTLPFLADFLSQGYTQEQVNSLYNRSKSMR